MAIGNEYVSPPDFTVTVVPILYEMSLINDVQYKELDKEAWNAYRVAESGNWTAFEHHDWWFRSSSLHEGTTQDNKSL